MSWNILNSWIIIHPLYLTFCRHVAFSIRPCKSSSGISLCPNGPGRCHQEWTWSRYHTDLSIPCQMQLCHPWHHLNLLKFNGSCTTGLNHLALQRVFACENDFGRCWNGQSDKCIMHFFHFSWTGGLLHHENVFLMHLVLHVIIFYISFH